MSEQAFFVHGAAVGMSKGRGIRGARRDEQIKAPPAGRVLACLAGARKARFDGHKVFRLTPATQLQVDALRALERDPGGLEFWTGVSRANASVDVMAAPGAAKALVGCLRRLGVAHSLLVQDVQRLIDNEQPDDVTGAADFGWDRYHRLEQIHSWLRSLVTDYPDTVTLLNLGKSYEGRDILGVKVSYRSGNPAVFVEAGIHAREWISPAVTTYILHQLLSSSDSGVRAAAEAYDWYFFPSVNPDGYEYSHTTNRMWRKTRSRGRLLCHGVDGNRNWDFRWRGGGSSGFPCSETYDGTGPFSEVEMRLVGDFVAGIASAVKIYLSIHSYSQLLLFPYGVAGLRAHNHDTLMDLGQKTAESIAKRYGTQYRVGSTVDVLYAASGVSPDWAHGALGVPVAFTVELRDTGAHGFLLPAAQILPSGEETLDGVVALVTAALPTF
ncbi:zinc carboxypeptidase-like [Bacillus rossius redtenbacheri]|uniref:zinc carboxypeptidase-like n=1 Tax=Bacillus rossius redtenbacheri TaxID=93214 RepID=UPI002FDC7B44